MYKSQYHIPTSTTNYLKITAPNPNAHDLERQLYVTVKIGAASVKVGTTGNVKINTTRIALSLADDYPAAIAFAIAYN